MSSSKTYNFPEGEVLLINKPSGWTSFDVVNKIRHMIRHYLGIRKIKVGHAGTLDPLATGLLLVCVGKATKRISDFTGLDKEYTGVFHIGATTPSYDLETEIDQQYETAHIDEQQIRAIAKTFVGPGMQVPPVYSAIKVEGTRAYIKAREKEEIKMAPRPVNIYEFEIIQAGVPETSFRVLCSKGTYVRSLAYDFGKSLQSGAYLKSLCRTKIGSFQIDEAISIEELEKVLSKINS